MGYVAKLIKGSQTLDLASGRYSLGLDFVPPATSFDANISTGLAMNISGESRFNSRRAVPRGMDLPIKIVGSSNAEIEKAANDLEYMLLQAGDEIEPLYLAWRPHSNYDFEPKWGTHDAYKLFKILAADDRSKWDRYGVADMRSKVLYIRAGVTINPTIKCARQRIGSATGGVFEDYIGQPTGRSAGPNISDTITNKMTNPVLGHATYDNGWTAGTYLIVTKNTDEKFTIFAGVSAKIVNDTAGTNRIFAQSINVGNTDTHIMSFYAKRPDGAAITSDDVIPYYNADAASPNYISVGNGWYFVWKDFAGINGAVSAGCKVKDGRTVYVDGFSLVEAAQPTITGYGDLMGWAWTGTAHASTSTRTAAYLRYPGDDVIENAEGTIRIVWRAPDFDSSALGSGRQLFAASSSFAAAWRVGPNNDWTFSDNVNTIDTAATSWSAREVIVFHFVWSTDGLVIYVNGSSAASGGTYTPAAVPTWFYLGSTTTPGSHMGGTFLGFETFPEAMSATEVSDDYDNVYQIVADDQQLAPIPWLWTKDGDDQVDNADGDVSGTDKQNWMVIGGIPGDLDTEPYCVVTMDNANNSALVMSRSALDLDDFIDPDGTLFFDRSGTVEAGTVGGEKDQASVTTAGASTITINPAKYRLLDGRDWIGVYRLSDAGSGELKFRVSISYFADSVTTGWVSQSFASGTYTCFIMPKLGDLISQGGHEIFLDDLEGYLDDDVDIQFQVQRVSGGAANVSTDFLMLMPRPFTTIIPVTSALFGNATELYFEGGRAVNVDPSTTSYQYRCNVDGDLLALSPNKLNLITCLLSENLGVFGVNYAMTFGTVYVTPRWSVV